MLLTFSIAILLLSGVWAQCPPGTSPLYTNNNQVSTCSPQQSCSCSSQRLGYFCQYSSQHTRYICCGANANQCPNSAAPQITESGNTVTCSTNSNCRSGYVCTQGVCCANSNTPECTNDNGNNGGVTPCLSGQVLINGVCMYQVSIGSLCQRNEQCLGGSHCLAGRCQCSNGYYPQNGQCISSNGACQLGTTLVNGQCLSLAFPGSSCVSSNQCLASSVCTNGICTCNSGSNMINGYCIPYNGGPCLQTQTMVNGQCVTYSIVGGNCLAEAQCVGGSTCQASQCVCRTGFSAMYGYCIQNPTGGNDCPNNQVLVNGYCYNYVSQGGSCMFSEQCLNAGYCNNGVCNGGNTNPVNCKTETQVSVNGQCLSLVALNEMCTRTEQCLSAAQCLNSRCQCGSQQTQVNGVCTGGNQCTVGQVLYNGQCLPVVSIGGNCMNHIQCGGNSRCSQGYCRCPTGTNQQNNQCVNPCGQGNVFVNGQCYPTVQVGSSCTFNDQCLSNSQCVNRFCACPNGASLVNGQCSSSRGVTCNNGMILIGNQCYQTVQYGGSCIYSQQCQGTNMQCINGRCQNTPCNSGMVSVNGQCYQTAQIGGYCSFTEQCLGNSQCTNSYCACPSGTNNNNGQCNTNGGNNDCGVNMIRILNQCYQTVQSGGSCTYSQQCIGSNLQCISNRCQNNPCNNGMVSVNGKCLQTAQIGGYCSFTEQCLGYSQCTNSYCTCPSGSRNSNGQCVTDSTSPCGTNSVSIGNQCYPLVQSGGSCTYSQQCIGNNIQCISNRCQNNPCNNGMVSVNGQCYQTAQIGGYCSFTEQCLGNSQCTNSFCTCPSGTTNNNGQCNTNGGNNDCGVNMIRILNQCYQTVQSGGSCTYSQQCIGSNLQCISNRCQNNPCNNGMVSVNGQCLQTAQIGGYCSFTEQCLGYSQCTNSYCTCPSGSRNSNGQCVTDNTPPCGTNSVSINNQCYPLVQSGGTCTYSQQCIGNNMQCISNRCQNNPCSNGMVSVNGQCYQTVQINGYCSFSEQCLGNSKCTNSYCTCPSGTTNNNGQCSTGGVTPPCGTNAVSINSQCYPLVQNGGSCSFTQQCIGSNIQCTANRCQPSSGNNNNMCAANEEAAYTNGQLVDCLKSACPASSYCTYSNIAGHYICCKTSSTNPTNPGRQLTCRNPSHTVVLQNNNPINCLLSTCPSTSYCDYDVNFSQYMCCQGSTTSTAVCTGNYYQNSNGSPYVCTQDSTCQFGNYRYCRRASNSVTYSVCCDRA